MSATEAFVHGIVAERARQTPHDGAYTFIDYELDPSGGYYETLTWSQLYTRMQAVAAELATCASPGDRVAILAPQSLDYIVGFLGALEAGLIAVPLPIPILGTHDERVSAALKDCLPAVILTTSAVAEDIDKCARELPGALPAIIEVDALDLDTPAARPLVSGTTQTAWLQYTSGSTRSPAGVVLTHENAITNMEQMIADLYENTEKRPPPGTSVVSWLPFYHDMGLLCGILFPLVGGVPSTLFSPTAFLQKPARWMQLVARAPGVFTGGPNFAYELAVRRTTDEDMAGLDLSRAHTLAISAERVHSATVRRIIERFSRVGLPAEAVRGAYGLAEATVYTSVGTPGKPPVTARFDYEKLSAGHAELCDEGGVELVGAGVPRATTVRIVDPQSRLELSAGMVGEIWVHGKNVGKGYWQNPEATERTFGGRLVDPSPGTPETQWLRTGDLGVISGGELFIVGRIKDLLIVDGRNHYPDDIESTIQEISGGRVAAITIPNDRTEQLVAIVELKQRGSSDEDVLQRIRNVKRELVSAISDSHGLRVADLVLVAPGSIPITTSGKIRRSACAERYQQDEFTRLDSA